MGLKKAALLVNLGTPDSPNVDDVRRYLSEFLMDPYVIDVPYVLRYCLINCIILPMRSHKASEAYRKIWSKDGSPLMVISKHLANAVQEKVNIPVELAMRYQNPSIHNAISNLNSLNIEEILVIPLFPQYAMSTFKSAVEAVKNYVKDSGFKIKITVNPPFYNDPNYISALSESVKECLTTSYNHIVFSYHGLPESHIKKTDVTRKHCLKVPNCCNTPSPSHQYCYRHQCFEITRLVVEKIGLPPEQYTVAFQSRFGFNKWLEPATADVLKNLPSRGIKKVLVACPSFVTDCIETLEEIAIRNRELFIESGGEDLKLIPCLNSNSQWVNTIAGWIKRFEE